ncbi:pyrroloquinoline quinone precursor peptide PqqA [Streptomyces sp. NPDC005811]
MNDTTEHAEHQPATTAPESDAAAWRTPGYTVVDTALEVTAYSLAAR